MSVSLEHELERESVQASTKDAESDDENDDESIASLHNEHGNVIIGSSDGSQKQSNPPRTSHRKKKERVQVSVAATSSLPPCVCR